MKVSPDIRPTTARERKRGAGKVFFGFRISMTWEEIKQLFKNLNPFK